jgi:hypothetical protein
MLIEKTSGGHLLSKFLLFGAVGASGMPGPAEPQSVRS